MPAGLLTAAAVALLAGEVGLIAAVPDDSAPLVALQLVSGGVAGCMGWLCGWMCDCLCGWSKASHAADAFTCRPASRKVQRVDSKEFTAAILAGNGGKNAKDVVASYHTKSGVGF